MHTVNGRRLIACLKRRKAFKHAKQCCSNILARSNIIKDRVVQDRSGFTGFGFVALQQYDTRVSGQPSAIMTCGFWLGVEL